MSQALADALALPGLHWVVLATLAAGLVYGFAGFGAALIFMPVATAILEPVLAVAAFSISALISLVTVVPQAWGQADRPATLELLGFSVLGLPLGLFLLARAEVELIRWLVLSVVAVTLAMLLLGWRRTTRESRASRAAVGAGAGLVGGATGLNGPVMVLFQLSSRDGAARSRANTICFLTLNSMALLPAMALMGVLPRDGVALGALLLVPYGVGSLAGRFLFDPANEGLYRGVAYAVIAAALVAGLPVWGAA
ncbi:MAG: TSUP family transporter [Pseudomonadota bacterium]